jgi:hypothetical protein
MAEKTGEITINETVLAEIDGDPRLSGGLDLPSSTFAIDNNNNKLYFKKTSSPTGWIDLNSFLDLTDQPVLDENYISTNEYVSSSSTVNTEISDLQVSLSSSKKYYLKIVIRYSSENENTGISFGVLNSGGAVFSPNLLVKTDNNLIGSFYPTIQNSGSLIATTAVAQTNTAFILIAEGIVICSTGGNLTPIFRSETNGVNLTVLSNSMLFLREVA